MAHREDPHGSHTLPAPGVDPDPTPSCTPHPRLLVERFSGWFWAWLGREEFLVPKNVLDIVAAQTVTWMGLFYCPLLPLLNSVFLFLTFYIKKVGAWDRHPKGCCILILPSLPGTSDSRVHKIPW